MAFWFQCPVCQSRRLATEGIIGRRVRCADCSNFVEVQPPPPESHVDDDEMNRLVDLLITEESLEETREESHKESHRESLDGDEVVLSEFHEELAESDSADHPTEEFDAGLADGGLEDGGLEDESFVVGGRVDEDLTTDQASDQISAERLEMQMNADESNEFDDPVGDSHDDESQDTESFYVESGEFALAPPSEEIHEIEALVDSSSGDDAGSSASNALEMTALVPGDVGDESLQDAPRAKKSLEWKTAATEEDPDYVEPPMQLGKREREETEMDMTPMVDVTFLLLIFFMVTASFVMQKSMNRPTQSTDDPSPTPIIFEEDNPDIVEVTIDEFNSFTVILPEEEPIEAPSEQDLRIALTTASLGGTTGIKPTKLLIRAHEDSFHEKVITAMDVGSDLDFALQVQIVQDLF